MCSGRRSSRKRNVRQSSVAFWTCSQFSHRSLARWCFGQGRSELLDYLGDGIDDGPGLVEKTQLVDGTRPNRAQHTRIERRGIGDDLGGRDPSRRPALQEARDVGLLDLAV